MIYRKEKTNYSKGDLVLVDTPHDSDLIKLCVIVSTTIPCVYKLNEFFMVYSLTTKEKFITVKKFMKKVVDKTL